MTQCLARRRQKKLETRSDPEWSETRSDPEWSRSDPEWSTNGPRMVPRMVPEPTGSTSGPQSGDGNPVLPVPKAQGDTNRRSLKARPPAPVRRVQIAHGTRRTSYLMVPIEWSLN